MKERLSNLLLKTAFSCMVCDGDIDEREIALIKNLHAEKNIFGDIVIDEKLTELLALIQSDASRFLKLYFTELSTINLSDDEQLKLIEVAIATIKADDEIEYSEIKFFKLIRSKLSISDDKIIIQHPDFEDYLEGDIFSDSYLAKFFDSFGSMSQQLFSKSVDFRGHNFE